MDFETLHSSADPFLIPASTAYIVCNKLWGVKEMGESERESEGAQNFKLKIVFKR